MTHGAPSPPAELPARLPAAEIARALDDILLRLLQLLWTRVRYTVLLGLLFGPVWTRLSRTRERLARALAHLAAGHASRPARPRATPRRAGPGAPFPHRRLGWLAAMADHHVRGHAAQVRHLLQQPGVAETIAASPGAARTLRPLCHMLGIELPTPLRPPHAPQPPPAKPAQPKPQQPKATPSGLAPQDRPIPPNVLAAARYWKRRGLENT